MSNTPTNLLPCPFCGGNAKVHGGFHNSPVTCEESCCQVVNVGTWNRRAALQSAADTPPSPYAHSRGIITELSKVYAAHLEEHDRAARVGGYVPLDDDYPIEVPLRLCRVAFESTEEGQL